jgi:arylsulfatase A-like enzyme
MITTGHVREGWTRRRFLHATGAAGLGAMASPWLAHAQVAAPARPNIVLIYVDDMGYGDVSCYNDQAWVRTPAIDKLAEDGVRFTQGYATAPVCFPSRVGLMTGAYQQRWGSYHNRPMITPPAEQKLIPTALKAAGYVTGMAGKWNGVKDADPSRFFDETHHVLGWTGQYWPVGPGEKRHELPAWGPDESGEEYETDTLTNHACDFIRTIHSSSISPTTPRTRRCGRRRNTGRRSPTCPPNPSASMPRWCCRSMRESPR